LIYIFPWRTVFLILEYLYGVKNERIDRLDDSAIVILD